MTDVEVRGDTNSQDVIVFVHGFGITRYDGAELFKDIADSLPSYRSILFDLNDERPSGLTINSINEQVHRVDEAIGKLEKNVNVTVIAHSLGAVIASKSQGVRERAQHVIVLTPAIGDLYTALHARFAERMHGQDETGEVTVKSKTVGELTFAPGFWPQLKATSPITQDVVSLTENLSSTVVSATHDEVLPGDMSDIFGESRCTSVNDNHNFTQDRKTLIETLKEDMS